MTNMGYLIRKKHEGRGQQHYFTSNDPHHGIYTFSYWQIFWHSIWHIFWHSIWHSIWHIFWHSIWHIFWHSIWHIFWHSVWHIFWHSIWPLRSGSAHCDLEVAVEVRQCPLRSGSRGWGPAVPTGIWSSRWRSGSAHWDLELAVEVRQCPLGSGARGGGPAVPTGIWTARRRRTRRRRMRRRRRTALTKSNNPHLAGGAKNICIFFTTCLGYKIMVPFKLVMYRFYLLFNKHLENIAL